MTATPIPRTLAITLNGDLDLTIIDELPKGRKPILTSMTTSRKQISDLIRHEVAEGRQAYIVYPLIDESETLSAKAATKEKERWETEVFPEYKVGLLHGKLKNDEKSSINLNNALGAKFPNIDFNWLHKLDEYFANLEETIRKAFINADKALNKFCSNVKNKFKKLFPTMSNVFGKLSGSISKSLNKANGTISKFSSKAKSTLNICAIWYKKLAGISTIPSSYEI
jgi:hypothetical protein